MEYLELVELIKKRKVILFGASAAAQTFLSSLPFFEFSHFLDNDVNKNGKTFLGKSIFLPSTLASEKKEDIFIVVTSMYKKEITLQLEELGFTYKEHLLHLDDIFKIVHHGQAFEPGHFYSPIPYLKDVKEKDDILFKKSKDVDLIGIPLNVEAQMELFSSIAPYVNEFSRLYGEKKFKRFHLDNTYFGLADASILYSMLKKNAPNRIVEVGSGFSSAVMLDTNDLNSELNIQLTFIDPNPQRLQSLLTESDKERVTIFAEKVQDVPVSVFSELEENDILFIDSSHVTKIGSDVNHIMFNILPVLKPGVKIHFHDIYYPFEYPSVWIYEGRYWNEAYLLRAFLQYNEQFSIEFWNDFIFSLHQNTVDRLLSTPNIRSGGSIWLTKR